MLELYYIKEIDYYIKNLQSNIESSKDFLININKLDNRFLLDINLDCDHIELWLRALRDKLENG